MGTVPWKIAARYLNFVKRNSYNSFAFASEHSKRLRNFSNTLNRGIF